jgi:hypothetical protein
MMYVCIPYFTKRSRIEIITFSKNKALLNKKWQIVYQNNHFLSWTNFDTNFDYDAIFDENPRQLPTRQIWPWPKKEVKAIVRMREQKTKGERRGQKHVMTYDVITPLSTVAATIPGNFLAQHLTSTIVLYITVLHKKITWPLSGKWLT